VITVTLTVLAGLALLVTAWVSWLNYRTVTLNVELAHRAGIGMVAAVERQTEAWRTNQNTLLENAAREREALIDRVQAPHAVAARLTPATPTFDVPSDDDIDRQWMTMDESELPVPPDLDLMDVDDLGVVEHVQ
jgi:hypothetical protein